MIDSAIDFTGVIASFIEEEKTQRDRAKESALYLYHEGRIEALRRVLFIYNTCLEKK